MNQLIKADIVLRNFAHRGFVSFKGKASELYLGRRQKQTEIYTLHLRKNKYIVEKKKVFGFNFPLCKANSFYLLNMTFYHSAMHHIIKKQSEDFCFKILTP